MLPILCKTSSCNVTDARDLRFIVAGMGKPESMTLKVNRPESIYLCSIGKGILPRAGGGLQLHYIMCVREREERWVGDRPLSLFFFLREQGVRPTLIHYLATRK